MTHHTVPDRPKPSFGQRGTVLEPGLREQLVGLEAASARQRRGYALRLALGFAAFGVAAALWAAPNVGDAANRMARAWQGDGEITTASVAGRRARRGERGPQISPLRSDTRTGEPVPRKRSYVMRRSVLQAPGEVCRVEGDLITCE